MIDAMIQSALLFAFVAIVTQLLKRRAPASLRHMFWAFAIVSALVAPLIARVSPLEFRVMPATTSGATATPTTSTQRDATPSPNRGDRLVDSAAVEESNPSPSQ